VEKAQSMTRALCQLAPQRFYKKIDSTLRGHWAAETRVMMKELQSRAAVIAPAYPPMGRRIVDGQLRTAGRDVDLIDHLVGRQDLAVMPIDHVSVEQLREGSANLRDWIMERVDRKQLFVVDSDNETDLNVVADAVASLTEAVLPVGSAGL